MRRLETELSSRKERKVTPEEIVGYSNNDENPVSDSKGHSNAPVTGIAILPASEFQKIPPYEILWGTGNSMEEAPRIEDDAASTGEHEEEAPAPENVDELLADDLADIHGEPRVSGEVDEIQGAGESSVTDLAVAEPNEDDYSPEAVLQRTRRMTQELRDDVEDLDLNMLMETPTARESLWEIQKTMKEIQHQLEKLNEPWEDPNPKKKHTLFGIFLDIELVLLAILFIVFLGVQIFGYVPKVVLSGSMEPTIPVGAVAYIDTNVKPSTLQVGDIAARKVDEDTEVMHRIVEINSDGKFLFKGDANKDYDLGEYSPDSIIGKELFHIPEVGYWMQFFMDNKLWIIIGLLMLNVMIWAISTLLTKDDTVEIQIGGPPAS